MRFTASMVSSLGLVLAQNVSFPGERKFNRIAEMVALEVTTALPANIIPKMLQNYGCYCFPSQGNLGGAGPTQDGYDALCRELDRCHRCVAKDFDGFEAFNNYRWNRDGSGNLVCTDSRNTPAMKALCQCDAKYATKLGHHWDDATYNYGLWKQKKNAQFNFDYATVCVRNLITDGDNGECCGAYPDRHPYNPAVKTCCADGQARMTGSC